MAIAACFGRGQMIDRLADRGHAVMARNTGLVDEGMIDHRTGELQGRMAGGTVVRRRHMVLGFTKSRLAVVAGDASPLHIVVIDAHLFHVGCDVTIVTGVGCRNMVAWLSLGISSVVAGCAGLTDAGVIKGEGHEVSRRVALGALIACRRVRGRFAFCAGSVVATHAIARRTGKLIVDMAALADDLGMCAGERNAELAVIKSFNRLYAVNRFLRTGGSRLREKHHKSKCQKSDKCKTADAPPKCLTDFSLLDEHNTHSGDSEMSFGPINFRYHFIVMIR